MSRVQVGGADLCDNLPSPDALTAQTRNFNETNALASLSPSQKQEGGGLIQRTSVNNNGKEEEQQGKEGYTTRGREEEDEEEDIDEWMKGVEEDEESEGSSGLIRCQSPETPMTDSSYSETGRQHTDVKDKQSHTVFASFFLPEAILLTAICRQ